MKRQHKEQSSGAGAVLRPGNIRPNDQLKGVKVTTKADIARHTYHPAQPVDAPTAAAQ